MTEFIHIGVSEENTKVAIIGLGYVGLPLAVEFGKRFDTVGYDINIDRISELRSGQDQTQEVPSREMAVAERLRFSSDSKDLVEANVYIVTVPTPIDKHHKPDLAPLKRASRTIGEVILPGNVVIYESTVYPGATEEDCVPIIEEVSGYRFNHDFYVGYSPERINPGDKEHRLVDILKVTSGSTDDTANFVDDLYSSIITAGTHRAPSIKVAEAAKVIENTQRDLNISLINELAMIFNRMGIDTEEVLKAAGTKWNFLPFRPGLVGGHCIGVDPYYLTYKAQSMGYYPEVILAGRRINDGMGEFVASQLVKQMLKQNMQVARAKIVIFGLTFKENCPDIRNTRVTDIFAALQEYNASVDVYDPWVDPEHALHEYDIELSSDLTKNYYDAAILAVAHDNFKELGAAGVKEFLKDNSVLYDLKYVLPKGEANLRL